MRRSIPRSAVYAVAGAAALALAASVAIPLSIQAREQPRGAYTDADAALVHAPANPAGAGQSFYFVMTDRFANGDPSNDTGGLTGDRTVTGFDPTDTGWFQGGDLAGLRQNLDYIEGLGVSAIWLTPSFLNKPVQGLGANQSAGYHGYWITDFTHIDPHVGTNEELEAIIDDAHARGLRVYFDIITNHTADVISSGPGAGTSYIATPAKPYLDVEGNAVDLDAVAGSDDFPEFDPASSFPYTPHVDPSETDIKVPAWLNDVTKYHNRGDSTWEGESVTLGDFSGLDDLMTEDPRVVEGFIDIYTGWMDLGIDGFRIDTVKHVNPEFWEAFTAGLDAHAEKMGKRDFFVFGEVFDPDAGVLARYVRELGLDAVLDFAFQDAALAFVNGKGAGELSQVFAADHRYANPASDARALPTFLGNHDMGRIGHLVRDDEALARDLLAHELMFLSRGQPVIYAGDEQGFTGVGDGRDRHARQSLFATQTAEYAEQTLITGEQLGSLDRFDTEAPLYTHIAALAELRAAHPALATGAQIERLADGQVYAFSRVDRDELVEHLVVLNASPVDMRIDVPTLTASSGFTPLYGTDETVAAGRERVAAVSVPAFSAVVLRARDPLTRVTPLDPTELAWRSPVGGTISGVDEIEVRTDDRWLETSFSWRTVGSDDWRLLGTVTGPNPYVVHDTRSLDPGTRIEYRAVSVDVSGMRAASSLVVEVVRTQQRGERRTAQTVSRAAMSLSMPSSTRSIP
ncbi:alpha-amylase family glycosyl hydrolase [Salinibacterium sp. ZJ77]|uniref:alpha-amylase family glycosyl hydrolase n=1 Tax=Salinibacterium sp. ZJ77 TaxID=2708337 RepID=UPI00142236AD|nr:alpha-amylase family glycosyl hydrolase [Salinibacterium sp. ZJ77]